MVEITEILARIKRERKKKGYSQDNVAGWFSVKRSAYTKKEKNMTPITVEELLLLCDRLGMNPVTLFREQDAVTGYADGIRDMLLTIPETDQRAIAQMVEWAIQGAKQRTALGGEKTASEEKRGD